MADTPTMPPLQMIADELYSLDPSDFVARRDAWAKQARTLKQRDLAAQIKDLRRPTVAASYLNRAVREPLESLLAFLDLGAPMREAQAALSVTELTRFGAQRRALEDAVIKDLVAMLTALDVQPSSAALDEVRQTLTAALADPDAEQVVRTGRLARSLTYAGFGPVDLDNALAAEPGATEPGATAPRDRSHLSVVRDPQASEQPRAAAEDERLAAERAARAERAERAERVLAEAQQAHTRAERAHERLTRAVERASQARAKAQVAREDAERRREQAQEELAAAQTALAAAEERLADAEGALEDADTMLGSVNRDRDEAATDLQRAADQLAEAGRSRDLDSGS